MIRYLHLNLPLRGRRRAKVASPSNESIDKPQRWCTPDGVEIWHAKKLYQACVEVSESDRPIRVVLLEDYEALLRSVSAIPDARIAESDAHESRELPQILPQRSAAID
jgi:hypothetical protein